MADYKLHEEVYKDHTIELYYDEISQDPKSWGTHLSKVSFHHGRYGFHDDADINPNEFEDVDAIWEHLEKYECAEIIRPVYMLDHSGIYFRMGRGFSDVDPQRWDWGMIGFAYVTREDIIKEYGDLSAESLEKAEKCLEAEMGELFGYYAGHVYLFVVLDDDGEVLDSVGGFYGDDGWKYAIEYAKYAIDHHRKTHYHQIALPLEVPND